MESIGENTQEDVKRVVSHIPCIDDLIDITNTIKQASEVSMITTLLAEILLVTTSRQATRMYFPITIFSDVWDMHKEPRDLADFFNTTGAGGCYLYKCASKMTPYNISGSMESEKAAQIVYHGIFGTFKEDLSVLEAITDIGRWFTREELGSYFRQQGTTEEITHFRLPKVKHYAKMSCANQTGLLSGVYNQVAIAPCFSGKREQSFDAAFFEHIEMRRGVATSGKTIVFPEVVAQQKRMFCIRVITQIQNILTSTLEDLHEKLRKDNGKLVMGTTKWRDMDSLDLGVPGKEIDIVIKTKSKMFLGRKDI